MKPHLEEYLKLKIYSKSPRRVIEHMLKRKMIASPKQAWATLSKWTGKGLYDYGCCMDLGWRTDKNKFQKPPEGGVN